MRLQAAISLLRLATVRKFADIIAENFTILAITIQDSCYHVRMTFVNKLVGLLTSRRLSNAYNVIPFLSIHDPEADVISLTKAYVIHAIRAMPKRKFVLFKYRSRLKLDTTTEIRLDTFEMLFLRILHLLAHHPDFAISEEALPDIAK